MILKTFLFTVTVIGLLSSCSIFNKDKVDAEFPTVAEMDALDVRWGLSKRKTRGGPRRFFQYYESKPGAAPAAPTMITPEPPEPAAPAPKPAAPAVSPAPVIPPALR
jgi:hypothetical protein